MITARPQGYILLALLIGLISLSAVYLTHSLYRQSLNSDQRSQRETLLALHNARLALIASSLIEDNTPGSLPSPSGPQNDAHELDGRSVAIGFSGTPSQAARRLPWHFLGLDVRSDGDGECLWYAVDENFRNNTPTANRSPGKGNAINPNTAGQLKLASLSTPQAALVFAPGRSLGTQTRGLSTPGLCTAGLVENFLDGTNANGDVEFEQAAASANFNDTVQGISSRQLIKPLLRRVLRKLAGPAGMQSLLESGLSSGNETVADTRLTDPAGFDTLLAGPGAELSNLAAPADCQGIRLPEGSIRYTDPVSWLCFNDWYSHMRYVTGNAVELRLDDYYQCHLKLDTGTVHCGKLS